MNPSDPIILYLLTLDESHTPLGPGSSDGMWMLWTLFVAYLIGSVWISWQPIQRHDGHD